MSRIIVLLLFVILAIGGYAVYSQMDSGGASAPPEGDAALADSPLSATYGIEGAYYTLQAGAVHDVTVSGDAWYGDVSGDSREDAVLVLNKAGAYYLTVAERVNTKFRGSNSLALPGFQVLTGMAFENGAVTISYQGEGGVQTKTVQLQNGTLSEIANP